MSKSKPDCYECKHRGSVPGDAHSCCRHPKLAGLKIKGDPYGIKMGWFAWPVNFDPVWLESCNGFEQK